MKTSVYLSFSRYFLLLLISLGLVACSVKTTAIKTSPQPPVHHVVLVWLNDDNNKVAIIDRIIQQSYQLTEIQTLKKIHAARAIPSERKIVDDSFDIGLSMQFANQADMQTYLTHPKHVAFVKSIKTHIKKLVVYDF